MNRLFLFLRVITMLFVCGFLGFCGFLLWEDAGLRREKKRNLDKFYTREIEDWSVVYHEILDGKVNSQDALKKINDTIERIEKTMREEGYDSAEIQQITFAGIDQADRRRKRLEDLGKALANPANHSAEETLSKASLTTQE